MLHSGSPVVRPLRAWLFFLLLAACQAPPPVTAPVTAPQAAPAPVPGAVAYRLDARNSEVRILVYRGGPLAKFGHSHVVQAGGLQGDIHVAPDVRHSTFQLVMAPAQFIVDPDDARAEEGPEFSGPLSPQAAAATRRNMLGPKVLDAENHPHITLQSVSLSGPEWAPDATVLIHLRGVSRQLTLPLAVQRDADTITITGTFSLRTSDFGIEPFTAMGGGLTVQDEVRIRFRLVARRAT